MNITFHDPRGQSSVVADPYTLGYDLEHNGSGKVAFLANGYPDSDRFLEQIDIAMRALLPNMKSQHWNKRNASVPASEEILGDIKGSCQAAVAAYGH